MKINLLFSIVALALAIVACVSCFRLFSFQPTPLKEENVLALIKEKTKSYITEEKATEILKQFAEKFEATVAEKEELEERIGNLEKRARGVDQLIGALQKKEKEIEQFVKRFNQTAVKETELYHRIAKLEEEEGKIKQGIENLEKKMRGINELSEKLEEKIFSPEITMTKDIYRISLLASSIDKEYKDSKGPNQYILIFVDGKKFLETHVVQNTFLVKWWPNYQKEIILEKITKKDRVFWLSKIEVYLMDKNLAKDKIIGHWTVSDPFELEKFPISESSVKFIVEKIEGKIVGILQKEKLQHLN